MDSNRLSRRNFLKTTTALAATGPFILGTKEAKKPNLLFIWTDEQRADTMAVYGNTHIHAPHLNKLASESVVFEHAYDTQPVCTPARATVMTGLWPHTTGMIRNNIALPGDAKCFPEILSDPDYRTGYMGKWHLGDEVFKQHGFEEWQSMEDQYWSYYSESRDKNTVSDYCRFLRELGIKPDEQERGTFSRGFCSNLPIEQCKPKFLELRACDFLKRHRNEPFMLYVNFLEPHPPFNGPLNDEHDPGEVVFPRNFNDPLEEDEPKRNRRHREENIRNKKGQLLTDEEWRRLIQVYWGLVTQVDRSVGAILAKLEDLGLADNTIVVYTSDHGDMMASHKMLHKSVMYEEAMRVPWLIRAPQLGPSQRVLKGRFSHIDLVPTLLDLMGHSTPDLLPGHSLLPAMKGSKAVENCVFCQWNGEADEEIKTHKSKRTMAAGSRASKSPSIRTVIAPDGWKLSLCDFDKCELFDLNTDPGETTNLYYKSGHDEVIRCLSERIRAWQESVKDPLRLPQLS
jgi:arylsulfatase A-like enzyme